MSALVQRFDPVEDISEAMRCLFGKDEAAECGVCLDEVSSHATRLKCQHVFHDACIAPWLQWHNTCPTCRAEVVMPRQAQVARGVDEFFRRTVMESAVHYGVFIVGMSAAFGLVDRVSAEVLFPSAMAVTGISLGLFKKLLSTQQPIFLSRKNIIAFFCLGFGLTGIGLGPQD